MLPIGQSMNISDVAYRAVTATSKCYLISCQSIFKVLPLGQSMYNVHSKSCLKRQSMHTSKFCLLGYQCILNILPKDTVHDYFKCCLSKRAVQTCLKCYLKGSPIIIKWCLKGSWFIQYFKCCLKGIPFIFKLLPKGAISAKKLSMFLSG